MTLPQRHATKILTSKKYYLIFISFLICVLMAEVKQTFQGLGFKDLRQAHWAKSRKDECFGNMEMELSSISDSNTSSSCAADLADDASSSSFISSDSSGPLFQLSVLMAQLPIKRGLSKFYNGKSQTFGSLANVRSVEDLAKDTTYSQRMKSCKSYGGNLNQHKYGPKPTIRKRSTVNRSFSPHLSTKGGIVVD